jgi:hypothetical protein
MPSLNYSITSIIKDIKDIKDIEQENILKENVLILKENNDIIEKSGVKFGVNTGLTPRSFKRALSSENFIKYQWAWTL